jgi:hypothetical protein
MGTLSLVVTYEENYYVGEIRDFDVICYNETLPGLFSDLYEELNILWKEFALEDDSVLDPSGITLKEKLLNFVNKL